MTRSIRLLQLSVVVLHSALIAVLVLMSAPLILRFIRESAALDVAPSLALKSLVAVLIATPAAVAVTMGAGLVGWLAGNRSPLIAVDFIAMWSAWSVMVVFALAGDLIIVVWVLTPAAFVVALLADQVITRGHHSPKRGEATPDRQQAPHDG